MSAPGATVRILPWTRVTGATNDARALVQSFATRCSSAQLDAATTAFVDGEPALQLPDAAILAEHDRRVE